MNRFMVQKLMFKNFKLIQVFKDKAKVPTNNVFELQPNNTNLVIICLNI